MYEVHMMRVQQYDTCHHMTYAEYIKYVLLISYGTAVHEGFWRLST